MKSFRRHVAADQGSALVELAVALPVLVLLLLGAADFARVFSTSIALTDAARAGAQYGAYSLARSTDTGGMQSTAQAAVNVSGVAASASRSCYCAPDNGSAFTAAACSATCTSSQHLLVTVSVTASKTFTTSSQLPGIPSSIALSRTATMRVAN